MTFILPPRTVPCEVSRAPGVVLPLANLDKAIAELSVADVNAGVDVKPPPLAREAVPGVDLGVRQRQPQINCPPSLEDSGLWPGDRWSYRFGQGGWSCLLLPFTFAPA